MKKSEDDCQQIDRERLIRGLLRCLLLEEYRNRGPNSPAPVREHEISVVEVADSSSVEPWRVLKSPV